MAFPNEVLNGTNMLLSVDGTSLGCSTSCAVEITAATRDASCKESAGWAVFFAGDKSWSMSSENFVNLSNADGYEAMFDALVAGDPVQVSCEVDISGDTFTLSGDAIITGLPITAPKGGNTTYSVSFQGTGVLAKTKVEA